MRLQWKRAFPTQLGILPLVARFTLYGSTVFLLVLSFFGARGLAVPGPVENIDYVVTFGAQTDMG